MKSLLFLCTLFLLTFSLRSQEDSIRYEAENSPIIGVGINNIGFYGDLNDRDYASPFGGNVGFDVFVIQPINDFLNVNFHLMVGKVREEERSVQRNLNFSSNIFVGGLMVEYNFDHFMPEYRRVTPFVTAGVELVQFNPKTDIEGFGGEPYNYWSDGTIRNLPENSPNADDAVIVQRDYDYETDIRDGGLNNSDTYQESAFSIPLGVGIDMHLTDQINFRFFSTLHLTFTDYMDGISRASKESFIGDKKANGRNDLFLTSGVALSYDFRKIPAGDGDFERKEKEQAVDYLALGYTEDQDGDGVIDLVDHCPLTPLNVKVDSLGCAVDSDNDGIPDYKDEEVNTEFPDYANAEGVEVTDEMIYESYLRYKDSTREMTEVIERTFSASSRKRKVYRYRVQVGKYQIGEVPKDMSKLLGLSDLGKVDQDGNTIYTAGRYNQFYQAKNREAQLKAEGYSNAVVLERNRRGKYVPIYGDRPGDKEGPQSSTGPEVVNPEDLASHSDEVVFRVQLGAFKTKPSSDKYNEIPSLIVTRSGDFYRYMSGSFNNFQDAASHKVKMVAEGYKGAFIVAYKGGKRVSLKSVGVESISSDPIIGK